MKQFYSQIIEIESLLVELDKLSLSETEKKHLSYLVDSNLHQVILDAILSELKPKDKEIFLKHLQANDHGKIWKLLKERIVQVENKIKLAAKNLKQQLHEDIKKAQKLKK
ncbi:hypothetical protein HY025_02815 [Candidatus Daviesbacteria bacterium]|nr:hypothetical protein [Candidatus Daviesbacteria bacterium]